MPKYPILSAREIIAVLKQAGFEVVKQKGTHIKLRKYKNGRKVTTIVPNHKTVAIGTLKSILELAELSLEKFKEYL